MSQLYKMCHLFLHCFTKIKQEIVWVSTYTSPIVMQIIIQPLTSLVNQLSLALFHTLFKNM